MLAILLLRTMPMSMHAAWGTARVALVLIIKQSIVPRLFVVQHALNMGIDINGVLQRKSPESIGSPSYPLN